MKAHDTQTARAPASSEQGPGAERLILLDHDGHARIGNGGFVGLTRLAICDDHGKIFIDLRVHQGEPQVLLFHNGVIRAMLGVLGDKSGLFLCDGKGTIRAELIVTAEGMPALRFHDTRGTTRAFMGLGPKGNGMVTMCDPDQTPRLGILNDQDGPNLFMLDKKGRTVWAAAAETPLPPSRPQAPPPPTRHRRRPAAGTRKGGKS